MQKVDEIVEYKEHHDGRTVAVRRAYISSQVFGFSRAIRAFGIERFKSNCQKTANGFNYVLTRMFPNQKFVPVNRSISGTESVKDTTTHSNVMAKMSAAPFEHHHNHTQSKTEAFQKGCKYSYDYLKSQALKIAQMFSVKN